jgi:hypothetical protein
MHSTKLRRSLAVSALAIAGALGAFAMGARAGAALDGQSNQMTVARIPMPVLQAAIAKSK